MYGARGRPEGGTDVLELEQFLQLNSRSVHSEGMVAKSVEAVLKRW